MFYCVSKFFGLENSILFEHFLTTLYTHIYTFPVKLPQRLERCAFSRFPSTIFVDAVGNLSFLYVRVPGIADTTERTKDQRMGVRGSKKSHRTPIVQSTLHHLRCLGLLALRLCQNRYDFVTLFSSISITSCPKNGLCGGKRKLT
jgi:hypothetical protein